MKDATGYIGIGVTNPDAPLHVKGGAAMAAGWNRTSVLQGTYPVQVFNSNSTKFAGIGYDFSAAMQFWVNATTNDLPATGRLAMSIKNDGNISAYGTITASNGLLGPSDIKFKKNLLPINTPLDKVLSLTGLTYEWKTDEYKEKNFQEGRHYGVIAQEIEKVLPEVVNTAPDGSKAVAYTEIIPVLIEAIKEQQKQIDELKKRLAEVGK